MFRLVAYVPGRFAIMLDEHFVAGIRFLDLETIAPALGVAVDNWTLCVRGKWRRAAGDYASLSPAAYCDP